MSINLECEVIIFMRHKLVGISEIALGWIKKYKLRYKMEDNSDYNYEVVSRNKIEKPSDLASKINAVSIICYDNNQNYVLLKEFRYAVNDYVIDFPAGLIDEGETVVHAAQRELYEETGLKGKVTYVLDGGFSSAGMTDERVAVCMIKVKDVSLLTNEHVDGNEDIEFIICNLFDMKSIANGERGKISNRVQYFMLGKTQF